MILTDGHYKILSILRVVQPNEKVRMAVGETYDIGALTRSFEPIQKQQLVDVLKAAGPKDILKKILNTKLCKVALSLSGDKYMRYARVSH